MNCACVLYGDHPHISQMSVPLLLFNSGYVEPCGPPSAHLACLTRCFLFLSLLLLCTVAALPDALGSATRSWHVMISRPHQALPAAEPLQAGCRPRHPEQPATKRLILVESSLVYADSWSLWYSYTLPLWAAVAPTTGACAASAAAAAVGSACDGCGSKHSMTGHKRDRSVARG